MPSRLPATDLADLERIVASDVEVWRDGKMVHDNRDDWFAELSSDPFPNWPSRNPPAGAGIARDEFYRTADGAIVVREFVSAIPPDGETIIYHLGFSLRFVTYTLDGGVLTRVDYGDGLNRMTPPQARGND